MKTNLESLKKFTKDELVMRVEKLENSNTRLTSELQELLIETERKQIIIEMDKYKGRIGQGTIEITSDTKDGYSSFKTHQEFPINYVRNCKEFISGEYKLIIK